MKLRPYQEEAVQAIESGWPEFQKQLLVLPTGCHDPEQGILMHDGAVKKARDICLGDMVMGDDGTPRRVLALHSGHAPMYKIVPVKGEPFTVNEDHVLSLVNTSTGNIQNISVKDYLNQNTTFKHEYKLYRSVAIECFGGEQSITVDPYFLGILLGDGSLLYNINVTTPNPEIAEEIQKQANKYGMTLRTQPSGKALTYFMKSGQVGCKGGTLRRELVALGVYGKKSTEKSIPFPYKVGSLEVRANILAGLLDTDGYQTCNEYDYVSASKQLAEDVVFISKSLGLSANISKCNKSNQYGFTGTYWRVTISGNCERIPLRVKRKQAQPRKQIKNVLRTGIKEIVPLGEGEYIGFTVDGNNLYLMDDFTVTHNCGKTVVFSQVAKDRTDLGRVLILAHRDELIEQARGKYHKLTGDFTAKEKASETSIGSFFPVTVGSVQTMMRESRLQKFDHDHFKTIIVDEAHHSLADGYQKVLNWFPGSDVLGVTATPDRGDRKELGKYYDRKAYEYSLLRAVSEGYLCKLKARTVPLQIDMSQVKVKVGDYEVNSIAETLGPYLPEMARAIKEYASDRKTIVFLPLISIAQEFRDYLINEGLDAREVNGQSPDRKETLEWFDKAGKGSILCNAMLLTEGFDCPSLDCVVVLRPTKIRSLYVQMVGRGTRTSPGKEDLLILDFLWMTTKHNLSKKFDLVKPADLVAEQMEDREVITKKSTEDEIDLLGAASDAVEARRNKLAEELKKQTKKKPKLINPLEWFVAINDMDLADYEPEFAWESDPITDKQLKLIEGAGLDPKGMTKGQASMIIDRIMNRRTEGLSTPKQISCLERFGYRDVSLWPFELASKKITELAAVGWKPYRLLVRPEEYMWNG